MHRLVHGYAGKPEIQMTSSADKTVAKWQAAVLEIKENLASYLERKTDMFSDRELVSIALLDMALDRYIGLHGEKDARHLIELAIRRSAARCRARRH